MASSDACVPGVMATSTLKRRGSERSSLTRRHSPISVAMEQCGMVGVKRTDTVLAALSTHTRSSCATLSCCGRR
jgi:hypothetical protein